MKIGFKLNPHQHLILAYNGKLYQILKERNYGSIILYPAKMLVKYKENSTANGGRGGIIKHIISIHESLLKTTT